MKVDYIFSRAEWPKLTANQRNTLIALKKAAKDNNGTTNTTTSSTTPRLVHTHVTVPSSDNASVTTDISGPSIRQVLSQSHVITPTTPNSTPTTLTINGTTLSINACNIQYTISKHQFTRSLGSLIDGGANSGVSGTDVTGLQNTFSNADITGLAGDQSLSGLPLCTVAGLIHTQKGPIIGIFNQYAYSGRGHTVHSAIK